MSGYGNNAMGFGVLNSNTTGYYNVAMGHVALNSNTDGYLNNAIGYQALYNNKSGQSNNAFGAYSLKNTTTGIFNNLPAGNYSIGLSDGNGCSSLPQLVSLTEPLTPITITTTSPVQPLTCPNVPDGIINLNISGGTGPNYTYLWSNGQTTQNLEGVNAGKYWVTIIDAVGCTMVDTFIVRGPDMLLITDSLITTAKCVHREVGVDDIGAIQIIKTTGGTGNRTYLWDFPLTVPATDSIIKNLSAGVYNVIITDGAGCKYPHSFTVPSDPAFYMNADAVKDTSICYGISIDLLAKTNETNNPLIRTYTYGWYELPETTTTVNTSSTFRISPLVPTNYLLKIKNDGLCISSDTVKVKVYPKIDLSIPQYISAVEDTIISILSGIRYNMDVNTAITVSPAFTWEPAILFNPADSWNSEIYFDNTISDQIPVNRRVDILDPLTGRRNSYILIDINALTVEGCKDSLRLYAKLVDKLTFGNIFSPNGDGKNDLWTVPKNYLFPDLEIEIFNRWGALVWSAKGDDAAKGWNGRTNRGNELPIGTYYYVIKYNINTTDGKWSPITGSITIVR